MFFLSYVLVFIVNTTSYVNLVGDIEVDLKHTVKRDIIGITIIKFYRSQRRKCRL